MIGDGLNDAGALAESRVGISIADDIYHFSPACDAILEASRLSTFHKFLTFPSVSMKVIRLSFIISILYNTVGIGFAVAGLLSPIVSAILMPLSSVSVVAFVSIGTSLLAKRRGIA